MSKTRPTSVRATLDGVPASIHYQSDGRAKITATDGRHLTVKAQSARIIMGDDGCFIHPFAKPKTGA